MNWSEKIQLVIKTLDLTQQVLADKVSVLMKKKIYQSYISDIAGGRNEHPSIDFVSALAHLGISTDWLLKDEGDIRKPGGIIGIPLYDIQASAGSGSVIDFLDNPSIITWLDIHAEIVERYGDRRIGAVRIYGDSMMPTYHSGDIAIFAVDLIDGDGVYLLGLDNSLFIKRLQFFPERNQLVIKSDNPHYEPRTIDSSACQSYFRIIGRVVGTLDWI